MDIGQFNSFKRQSSEFHFSYKPTKFKKSASFQTKNSFARLRVFNEKGVQQNDEFYVNHHHKKSSIVPEQISSNQIMLKKSSLSLIYSQQPKISQQQFYQQQQLNQAFQQQFTITGGQESSQQDDQDKPKFFNLITQLKMKKIARNFINSLPLRRFQFLKNKQYAIINDKSNDVYLDKSKLQSIEASQKKQLCQIGDKFLKILPIFQPSNKYKLSWDVLQQIAIMTFLFCIPIHLALDIQLEGLINIHFLMMMLIILSFDIIVNFNTGFFDKGELITSRGRIAQNYLKNTFIIDACSMLPLILHFILFKQFQQQFISFSLLLFFFKSRCFAKMFRKVEEALRMKQIAVNVLQLFKLLSTVLFFTHIFACIWIFTGKNSNQNTTWINQFQLQDAKWYSIYLKAYYFVTVTMVTVGYGDIFPQNQLEILVSILIMLISCGVFAYTLNQIGVIFEELQSQSRQTQKNLMVLNNYMDSKNISFSLKYQIREYLDYYWKESNQNNNQLEQQILSQLSDNLKQNLLIEANKIILKDSPIFNVNFSDKLLQKTLPLIQEMHCTPEQIIFSQNQIESHDIYFIEKGKIEVFIPLNSKKSRSSSGFMKTQLQILREGDSFGERSFFAGTERNLSARSVDFTKLLFIRRNEFIELLKEFPQDYEAFCMIKDLIFQGSIDKIGMKCYSCENSSKHDFYECPYTHFIPNKYKTIRREKFKRFQHKRKALKELNQNRQSIETFIEKNESIIATQNWMNLQDSEEYCIEEYSDEGLSEESFTSQSSSSKSSSSSSSSSSQSSSSNSISRDEKEISILTNTINTTKLQTKFQFDENKVIPFSQINFVENNYKFENQDPIKLMEHQLKTKSDSQKSSKDQNYKQDLQAQKPPLIQKAANKNNFKILSPNSKKIALSNLQKLKKNKPNQNILNLPDTLEGDSPISQNKSHKGYNYSKYKKKRAPKFLENQNINVQEFSICNSSVNDIKATPTMKKKLSQTNKRRIQSPISLRSKRMTVHKKSDKNQFKENNNIQQTENSFFVLERPRNTTYTQQKNQENEQGYINDNLSPQFSYKAQNKFQQPSQFNRQISINKQSSSSYRQNSQNVYSQDHVVTSQGYQEVSSPWIVLENRIREPIEDFDRQRLYSKYFTKFNYDRIIRSYNIITMRNIRNIMKLKNINRRQTLQSGINVFSNQLLNSPYSSKQLAQNASHIFDSSLKQKNSVQQTHSNVKKSSEYLDDEIPEDKTNFQLNEISGSHSQIPSQSTNLQVPSAVNIKHFKLSKTIQSGQFRRRSLMAKSPQFLEYALRKYSASQDLNEENLNENLSPAPQINPDQLKTLASLRRRSIELDLKSIKSIQEIGSHADIDDQIDTLGNAFPLRRQKIPSTNEIKNNHIPTQSRNFISVHSSPLSQSSMSSQKRLSILNQLQFKIDSDQKIGSQTYLQFSKRQGTDEDNEQGMTQKAYIQTKSDESDQNNILDTKY